MRCLHNSAGYIEIVKDMKTKLAEARQYEKVPEALLLRTENTLFPSLKEFGTFIIDEVRF